MTDEDLKQEREIDIVLAHASRPAVPPGARERLLARLPAKPATVEPFPSGRRKHGSAPWTAVAALAASFAFGIYLGTTGVGDDLWPVEPADAETVIGLGEAEAYFDGGGT